MTNKKIIYAEDLHKALCDVLDNDKNVPMYICATVDQYFDEVPEMNPDELPVVQNLKKEIESLKASIANSIQLPCEIGTNVWHKTEHWNGTVKEIAINDTGIYLFVVSGGYNGYYRPDELVF